MSRGDRVRVGALVLIVALASVAAGIGLRNDRAVTGPATLQAIDERCRAFERDGVPAANGQVPLPEDITVTEALWCTRPEAGNDRRVLELHATDGLDLVTAAFQRPDVATPDDTCPTPQERFGRVWLRTADGSWIEARWPQSACGPQQDALDLVRRAPFTATSSAS